MSDEIVVEVDDPVCTITLDRPETLNALTYPMLGAFRTAIDGAARNPKVVGIVVTGAGRGFCSGLDASVLQATTTAGSGTRPAATEDVPGLFTWLLRVPKPIISAVNGVAAGGGFVLTAMSDLRIASSAGSFTTIFSKRGLIAEHGMTWLVPRLIGTGAALDLLWSSRKIDSSCAAGQGFAALRHPILTTRRAAIGTADHTRRASTAQRAACRASRMGARRVASHRMRSAATLRTSQRTVGAAALIEKRGPAFPRLGA